MSEALLKNTFQKISPAYELVADVTVGTATNRVDFNGLSFGKDDDLLLVIDLLGNNGLLNLYVNDNVTDTNYWRQGLTTVDTTVSASRVNSSTILAGASGLRELLFAKLKLANSGYFVVQTERNTNYGLSSAGMGNIYLSSTFTITSITKLSLITSANNIGIGSRFQLYRLKAKKVADIIVSSATTQVDITGLNLDKDSEYMLVSDVVNSSAGNSQIRLYPNGNNTTTNYYAQVIHAIGTSISSSRYNLNFTQVAYASKKTFSISKIKLTNNGYYVVQSNVIRAYGESGIELYKAYMTSTFTLTSITNLLIQAEVSDAIGIGSRFTLYRLDKGTPTPNSLITKVGNLVYMTANNAPSPYVATTDVTPSSGSAFNAFDNSSTSEVVWNNGTGIAWAKMVWTNPILIKKMIVRILRSGQANSTVRMYGVKSDASEVLIYTGSVPDADTEVVSTDQTTQFVGLRVEIDRRSDLIVRIKNARIIEWVDLV